MNTRVAFTFVLSLYCSMPAYAATTAPDGLSVGKAATQSNSRDVFASDTTPTPAKPAGGKSTSTDAANSDPKAQAGTPLADLTPQQTYIKGLGNVDLNSDAPSARGDKTQAADDKAYHCSRFFYGRPQVHGVVGTGFDSASHYGTGEFVGGAVTAAQAIGNCHRPKGVISVTVGGIAGRGFNPYFGP